MALKSVAYKGSTFEISYEILNAGAEVDFVLLHGWGSNKELMKGSFSPYMKNFRHIYIDMPGFGKSSCDIVLTTADYAHIMELFLEEIKVSKDIVLGHSFGGKVATLLKPKLLVLVGSAGIFVKKSLKIRTKIALFKTLKVFGLAKLRSLFVAEDAKALSEEMYETFKNVVDEDFSEKFRSFDSKALLFWGRDDTATPLSSAETIASLMSDATLEVYDGDHYFFMKHSSDITKKIEENF
jgi:pimeloyl-ACP methyl ester carboxylesterase